MLEYEKQAEAILNLVNVFIDNVVEDNKQNEQWFISFLDELNKQSVRV